ncbi:MAG TPA: ABC transporter substrate-binding protein [Vicinamibacterales bacterium]|nr:ABC transporter substrate-binding protein [Vicinamibacterales bacterium]
MAGGRLVATMRSDPQSFNRLVAPFAGVDLVSRLTQASLVRLNRSTGELEPRLAHHWAVSGDGLTWTLELVAARFSDGEPFTSADVAFTFEALYDPGVKSELGSSLRIAGAPLQVETPDSRTVVIRFPAPYGAGLQLLDALPILPRHRLAEALANGTFRDAWGLSSPPSDIVGLGPFVLDGYTPGRQLLFGRNPHFWLRAESGAVLPYLDELEVQIVSDVNTEMLRLEAGVVDLTTDEIRAEDYAAMRRLEERGRVKLASAGVTVSPHALWFNLSPTASDERAWLRHPAFRRAVSHAVDRRSLIDTVYLGAAEPIFGPVTPGHGDWYLPDLPRTDFDPGAARDLLSSAGLTDGNGDGVLEDAGGRPVRFSILTARGSGVRDRSVAVIQDHLSRVGLTVDVIALDVGSMVARWQARDYDTMFFYVAFDSFDPARSMEFWLSSGSFHFWNASQSTPATSWEAHIDDLMRQQATTLDHAERQRLFAEAQRTLAEHLPILYFAAPQVTYATSARVEGARPSVLQPAILWNAETLSVTAAGATTER